MRVELSCSQQGKMADVKIRRVGASALLIEVDEPLAWFAALAEFRAEGHIEVAEIVPGARTVLLDGVPEPDRLAQLLHGWPAPTRTDESPARSVTIEVVYDGTDLDFVAASWNVSVEAAVQRIASTPFTVAFCGFAPGFAYLAGLPTELAVPRLASPRTRVPAGSVALAGEYAGIYPTASPGGWRLVGRTEATLFDVDREPPALLTPGTHVRLEAT
jgi:KipI family sensor histidine kinase inhibitor